MFKRKIKVLTNIFCTTTSCMLLAVALFTTVINPVERVESMLLWQIPGVAALLTLVSLIYPWDRFMGKRELAARVALHYILINVGVLGSGALFDWYDPGDLGSVFAMLITIAVVFVTVFGINWSRSVKDAKQMNEKLSKYKKTC